MNEEYIILTYINQYIYIYMYVFNTYLLCRGDYMAGQKNLMTKDNHYKYVSYN